MMWKQVVFFLLLSCLISFVNSIPYEEDTTISATERDALRRFKAAVIPKVPPSSYIQNYIKDDIYWVHWLRTKRFNVRQAEELFLKHLKWREQNEMDTIREDDEEFAEFHKTFPAYDGSTDKIGRPIFELWIGDWNLRQGVIAGQRKNLVFGTARFFEFTQRRVFKSRAEGKAISQGHILVELGNFNVISSACVPCLGVFVSYATIFENHYPYLFDQIMLINIPQAFSVVLNLVDPIFTDYAKKGIKKYPSKREWQKVLDELADKDQRSVRLGGTIVRE